MVSLFTNHPKLADEVAFNQALCGMYAAGLGGQSARVAEPITARAVATPPPVRRTVGTPEPVTQPAVAAIANQPAAEKPAKLSPSADRYSELGQIFAGVLDRGWEIYRGEQPRTNAAPIVITGAALGLPGTEHIFDDSNVARILRGEQFITSIPARFRTCHAGEAYHATGEEREGEATFETITDVADVIKLAGRGGAFDLEKEFGVPPNASLPSTG